MGRNYLLDPEGDKINTLLAAAGFNLRKMLQRIKAEALEIFILFFPKKSDVILGSYYPIYMRFF